MLLQCTMNTLKKEIEWEKIVVLIPTKTPTQISIHYAHLPEEIESIESGLIPPPRFQE